MKKVFLFAAVMIAVNIAQAQWQPDVRLTNDTASSWTSWGSQRSIAVTGDTVHVIWMDDRTGFYEIYYKRSTDGGVNWGPDTRVTYAAVDAEYPTISVSGSTVHIVWEDYRSGHAELYYKRSTDQGTTWDSEQRLTYANIDAEYPSVAVAGSVVHVVWNDDRNGPDANIYYKRSTDGGVNWEADIRLTTDMAGSYYPCVSVSGSFVHVVWGDYRNGDQIYYKRSTDAGTTWDADKQLSSGSVGSYDPALSVSGSVVHTVWCDLRDGNYEIYYKRSTDGGMNWGADTRLTIASGYSYSASIAVSDTIVHIVWEDHRTGASELFYKRSVDGGITWEPDTRLTFNTAISESPSVATSSSVVHVVWEDQRDGNKEIYYKRNPTGNPVGIGDNLTINSGQHINIFPNPASTTLQVNFKNYSNENSLLTIKNLLGEELICQLIQSVQTVIDISNLQNGLYFVKITTGNKQTVSTKLIIQK
jgi:Secretion system C-terminal sorting domain/BNR repeat-like domain